MKNKQIYLIQIEYRDCSLITLGYTKSKKEANNIAERFLSILKKYKSVKDDLEEINLKRIAEYYNNPCYDDSVFIEQSREVLLKKLSTHELNTLIKVFGKHDVLLTHKILVRFEIYIEKVKPCDLFS